MKQTHLILAACMVALTLSLRAPSVTADKRHVGAIQKTMTAATDTPGRYTIAIQTGLSYIVSNLSLFGSAGKKITIPAAATVLNIADL